MIIKLDELYLLREKYKNKKIVFCSGTFDLTHAGHVLFFEDCKKYGDILVVGVGSDKIIQNYKGKERPIQNEYIRLKMIDSLKPVDYCILNDSFSADDNLTTSLSPIFEKLRANIWVINEDAFDIHKRRDFASKFNTKLVILPRYCPPEFDGISTTKIIEKIKRLKTSL